MDSVMKKSERLINEANKIESDSKAFGLYTKAVREERIERFQDDWIDKFKACGMDISYDESQYKYTMEADKFGTIDFYPKANKVLIRKKNKWIKPGLRWLISKFLG